MSLARAHEAGKEIFLLKSEAEAEKNVCSVREAKLTRKHDSDIRRAFRRGRREVDSICQNRSVQTATELEEMSRVQTTFGDFHECKGAVGALKFMKTTGFNYDK
ncbi:hypothetical protein Bca52824_081767 [Brassica carinata]|uniref:Uncharacterized protein n=1 Tax=Brassica carinata TaxID=52824 RepID=A0A8X7TTJ9_BRACI|nr:hypothetical protein Bca52824_081767 [Brassica carinata]